MVKRRYVLVIILSWLFIALITAYLALEPRRLPAAESHYGTRLSSMGRIIYAENCANCHGSAGEGVVGPPLYRTSFRGIPSKLPDTFTLLVTTIEDGRPGTTDPHWVRQSNGAFASYTGMSAWSRDKGGPLNNQQVQALATFIMTGTWHDVPEVIPPPILPTKSTGGLDIDEVYRRMPEGKGVPASVQQAAKQLLRTKTCIQCHTVGRTGGQVGPNLTKVGSWGINQQFIKLWIKNPPKVVHRAPEYWSNYAGPMQTPPPVTPSIDKVAADHTGGHMVASQNLPSLPGSSQIPTSVPLGPTQMPVLALTDSEAETIATYLFGLK